MAVDIKKFVKFDAILKLSLGKKLGVLGGVCALIIASMGYFLIYPKYEEIAKLTVDLEELNKKVEEQRSIAANIPKLRAEKEELLKKFEIALKQLPNEKEIPSLLKQISDAATRAGLKIILFKPNNETVKGFYAEVPVTMQVTGSFKSFFVFCDDVAQFQRIVNISGVTLTSGTSEGNNPGLNANFTAITFRFVPNSAASPAPAAGAKK